MNTLHPESGLTIVPLTTVDMNSLDMWNARSATDFELRKLLAMQSPEVQWVKNKGCEIIYNDTVNYYEASNHFIIAAAMTEEVLAEFLLTFK